MHFFTVFKYIFTERYCFKCDGITVSWRQNQLFEAVTEGRQEESQAHILTHEAPIMGYQIWCIQVPMSWKQIIL